MCCRVHHRGPRYHTAYFRHKQTREVFVFVGKVTNFRYPLLIIVFISEHRIDNAMPATHIVLRWALPVDPPSLAARAEAYIATKRPICEFNRAVAELQDDIARGRTNATAIARLPAELLTHIEKWVQDIEYEGRYEEFYQSHRCVLNQCDHAVDRSDVDPNAGTMFMNQRDRDAHATTLASYSHELKKLVAKNCAMVGQKEGMAFTGH